MLKTEYREYINSPEWQQRRKDFLASHPSCARCKLPRWLAVIAYDQDLNVHHRTYGNLGAEDFDTDLEPLCRRCHELEEYRRSDLREPKSAVCKVCGAKHWNPYSNLCMVCDTVFGTRYLETENSLHSSGNSIGHALVSLMTYFWILRGRSRELFLTEMDNVYESVLKAVPKIAL